MDQVKPFRTASSRCVLYGLCFKLLDDLKKVAVQMHVIFLNRAFKTTAFKSALNVIS